MLMGAVMEGLYIIVSFGVALVKALLNRPRDGFGGGSAA